MSKIQDEFSGVTGMSKQRRYQMRRLPDGKCIFCGRPAVITGKCEEHRQRFNITDREKMRRRTGATSRYKTPRAIPSRLGKEGKNDENC
jgi:hypothetical protein